MLPLFMLRLDFTSPWTWIGFLLIVFFLVFLTYIIGALVQRNAVVITRPLKKNGDEKMTKADLVYFLPRVQLTLKATAKTQGNRLISLQVVPTTNLEPDTDHPYLLQYQPSSFSNDEIELKVDENGMLDNLKVTTEDRLSHVVALLSGAPKAITEYERTAHIKDFRQKAMESELPVVEHVHEFLISPEELYRETINCTWQIPVTNESNEEVFADASFTLHKGATPLQNLAASERRNGVLTRILFKQKVRITSPGLRNEGRFDLLMPDPRTLLTVPINRSAFVKKVHLPKFSNGFLVENNIQKPSQMEAFASIPINILKAIVSIPAQLISFRINMVKKETELLQAQLALKKAGEVVEKQQEVIEKLEKAVENIEDKNDKTEEPADPTTPVIADAIFIEALEKEEANWKDLYNLVDVAIGYKERDGIVTQQKSLIFRPMEKPAPLPTRIVPPFIVFKASDGQTYRLPTDVQASRGSITPGFESNPNEACDRNTPKLSGCSISRLDSPETGTFGLKLYRNKRPVILSCYHVICATELNMGITKFDSLKQGDKEVISPGIGSSGTQKNVIGVVARGVLSRTMDAAIADITDELQISGRICRTNLEPTETIFIGSQHLNMTVYMSGATSQLRGSSIKSFYCSPDIDYPVVGTIRMSGLIATGPMALGGDSGSAVFDDAGRVVGMVVARSEANTYVLPISRILSHFNATIKP